MESSAADLPALQQQHDQLSAQMEECERLAALNSELRLISHNMEELQEEQVQLKPQAELGQELRRHNQQLEHEAAHLPSIKVRCRAKCLLLSSLLAVALGEFVFRWLHLTVCMRVSRLQQGHARVNA
jgi:hypothetical protein